MELRKRIKYTNDFFRNTGMWLSLKRMIKRDVRVLDAGCSVGMMTYSMAIFLKERGLKGRIVGIDNNEEMIDIAIKGEYDIALTGLDIGRIGLANMKAVLPRTPEKKYFIRTQNKLLIHNIPRPRFMYCDVMDFDETGFDVVFCQNIACYYNLPDREAILEHLSGRLAPGGIMIVGRWDGVPRLKKKTPYIYKKI